MAGTQKGMFSLFLQILLLFPFTNGKPNFIIMLMDDVSMLDYVWLLFSTRYPDSEPAPSPYGISTGNPGHSGICLGMGKPSQITYESRTGWPMISPWSGKRTHGRFGPWLPGRGPWGLALGDPSVDWPWPWIGVKKNGRHLVFWFWTKIIWFYTVYTLDWRILFC